jgi:starch synthase
MRHWLSAADILVSASRIDGMPVAPLEAMACGLPVVATAAHGTTDNFAGGESHGGIIVDVGGSSALARAIQRVLNDAALRVQLGTRAH